jgi:PAS domain S-box-containing protein
VVTLGEREAQATPQERFATDHPQRHSLLFEQSPFAIAIYDADLRIVDCNRRCVEILGTTYDKLLGFNLAGIEDGRFPIEVLRRPLAGEPAVFEGPYRSTLSGRELVLSLRTVPLQEQGAAVGGVAYFEEVTEIWRMRDSLHELQDRTRAQFKGLPIPTYAWQVRADGEPILVDYNDAAVIITEGSVAKLVGVTLTDLFGDTEPAHEIRRCWTEQVTVRRCGRHTLSTGITKHLSMTYSPVPPDLVIVHTEDITTRVQLEEQLHQSQKLNAVGQLAGGIAHDFNNLLMVITGCTGLLSQGIDEASPAREYVDLIRQAADGASALTRQLLAFSRKQILEPRRVDLNEVTRRVHGMVRRLIGEDLKIELRLDPNLWTTRVDPGQMEQVIVNLTVNARDAMVQGGTFTLATANVTLDEDEARRRGAPGPGAYVQLTAADTGKGMDAETRARVFEPFFTTKDPSRGVGLGLSTVYGIVSQSAGSVRVESEPGRGTTFEILLPRENPASGVAAGAGPASLETPRGTETVLLVEDEALVRTVCRRLLERLGYTVLEASGARDALEIAALSRTIDLLMTDMVMPDRDGRQTAVALRAARPGLPVLFVTGYTEDDVTRRAGGGEGAAVLRKPFDEHELAIAVRRALGAGAVPEQRRS